MGLLHRYILRRVTALTLPTLAVISGIVITTQLLLNVEMVTRSATAALGFFQIAIFLIPSVTLLVLPFAILVGALRTLSTMNADSELAVLESLGRSPFATTLPVIIFSVAASLLTILTAHSLEPASSRAMQDTLNAASADLIRSAVRSGSFTQLKTDTFVQIGEELPNGEMAKIVFIDNSDPTTQIIYYAKRGNLVEHEGSTLFALADGEVHRLNRFDGGLSVISFASSAINLITGNQAAPYAWQSYSTPALFERIASERALGNNPTDEVRELHRRFSEWMYPLLFGAIAAFVAGRARTGRTSRVLPYVGGIGVALALRAAGFITISNSAFSTVSAVLSYAVPAAAIVVFLVLGATSRSLPRPAAQAAPAMPGALAGGAAR